MPVFVACPACGCRVQMTEGTIGQRVRCIACNERFVADPNVKPPPAPPRRSPERAAPDLSRWRGQPSPPAGEEEFGPDGRPFCPGCGRRVNWDWVTCFHCGEPFDQADDSRSRDPERWLRSRPRRDCLPHRGSLLATMGNITLAIGAVSLCMMGLGVLITVPLGITTMVMATGDLNQMRSGQIDPSGRRQTAQARTAALTGLALSLIFAAGWLLLKLAQL